jgi:hypothetical protein
VSEFEGMFADNFARMGVMKLTEIVPRQEPEVPSAVSLALRALATEASSTAWRAHVRRATGEQRPEAVAKALRRRGDDVVAAIAGTTCPSKSVLRLVEARVPGSTAYFSEGPSKLFVAMFGDALSAWPLAVLYEDDGAETIGPDVPIELCAERMASLLGIVASEEPVDLATLVAALAMVRLSHDAAEWIGQARVRFVVLVQDLLSRPGPGVDAIEADGLAQIVARWLAMVACTDDPWRKVLPTVFHEGRTMADAAHRGLSFAGRPSRSFQDQMRSKAWYWFLCQQAGAATPDQLARHLADAWQKVGARVSDYSADVQAAMETWGRRAKDESNELIRHRDGLITPSPTKRQAFGVLVKGSGPFYWAGPAGLFEVLFADAEVSRSASKAALLAGGVSVADGGGVAGALAVLGRLTRRTAARVGMSAFVGFLGIFRWYIETSERCLLQDRDAFEGCWLIWRYAPEVLEVLQAVGIHQEVGQWMANLQRRLLIHDRRLRLMVAARRLEGDEEDCTELYLADPLSYRRRSTTLEPA